MNWRDLLYFSKGERRALTLLLCLISVSWIILFVTDDKPDASLSGSEQMQVAETVKTTPLVTTGKPVPGKTSSSTSERKNTAFRKKKEFLPRKTGNTSGRKSFQKVEKFPDGTVVELNAADTTTLQKVPGIGRTFSNRISKYRELLGGFYTVEQLREVYGIDEEQYNAMKAWFSADASLVCPLDVHKVSIKELYRHPYLNSKQARVIDQLRKQKGRLTGWENLQLLEEFTDADKTRLSPYLAFE